jgi:hypothetical protein
MAPSGPVRSLHPNNSQTQLGSLHVSRLSLWIHQLWILEISHALGASVVCGPVEVAGKKLVAEVQASILVHSSLFVRLPLCALCVLNALCV